MKRPISSLGTLDTVAAGDDDADTREVTVTLRMTRDDVAVRASIPIGPTRPLRFLPLFRAITNAVVDRAENATAARGEPISCKAGCGACCRQLVPISQTETHFIRDLVEDLPPARRHLVEKRFAAARDRLQETGMLERLLHPGPLDDEQFLQLGFDYFALGIPCPFLEEESCSIHPERPVICREFLVTSPADLCADPSAGKAKRLLIEGDVSQALNLLDGDDLPARGVHWVPLVLAPEWAITHPDLDPPLPSEELLGRALTLVQEHAAKPERRGKKRKKRKKPR